MDSAAPADVVSLAAASLPALEQKNHPMSTASSVGGIFHHVSNTKRRITTRYDQHQPQKPPGKNPLSDKLDAWRSLGISQTLDTWLQHGVPVPLKPGVTRPHFRHSNPPHSRVHAQFLRQEIDSLLRCGFIEQCQEHSTMCPYARQTETSLDSPLITGIIAGCHFRSV